MVITQVLQQWLNHWKDNKCPACKKGPELHHLMIISDDEKVPPKVVCKYDADGNLLPVFKRFFKADYENVSQTSLDQTPIPGTVLSHRQKWQAAIAKAVAEAEDRHQQTQEADRLDHQRELAAEREKHQQAITDLEDAHQGELEGTRLLLGHEAEEAQQKFARILKQMQEETDAKLAEQQRDLIEALKLEPQLRAALTFVETISQVMRIPIKDSEGKPVNTDYLLGQAAMRFESIQSDVDELRKKLLAQTQTATAQTGRIRELEEKLEQLKRGREAAEPKQPTLQVVRDTPAPPPIPSAARKG